MKISVEEADKLYARLHKKYGTSEETIRKRNAFFDRPVISLPVNLKVSKTGSVVTREDEPGDRDWSQTKE